MIVTEKEAEKKVCPYLSVPNLEPCVASRCMAWAWILWEPNTDPDRRGYCSLMGRK